MKKFLSALLAVTMIFSVWAAFADNDASIMASVSTPTITFTNVLEGVQVTISCSTSSATIYYTTDGTTPTTSADEYTGSFVLDEAGSYTIKARAYKSSSSSSTATGTKTVYDCGYEDALGSSYAISGSYISTGTYAGQLLISFNNPDSSKYSIYYTTGTTSEPTTSSNAAASFYIKKPTVINVRAYRKGYAPSSVISLKATTSSWSGIETVATPSVKVQNSYGKKTVIISTDTEDATIYYKLTSSLDDMPSELTESNASVYSEFSISTAGTYYIKAYAVKDGMFDSDQTTTQSGTRVVVTVETEETDVDIFYTTDGSTPTSSSYQYSGAVTIGTSCTFKAIAARKGSENSNTVSAAITASGGTSVENPTGSSALNSDGSKTFTLSCSTTGASIYYAITPQTTTSHEITTSDTLYSSPFTIDVSGSYYIYFAAYLDGVFSSTVRASTTVEMSEDGSTPATPVGSVETLSNGIKAFSLSCSTSGCSIYYVISDASEGEVPTEDENLYTYPLTINETKYVSAIAVNSSGESSDVYRAKISIENGPITPDTVGALSMTQTSVSGGVDVYLDCADTAADIFYCFDTDSSASASTASTAYTRGTAVSLTSDGYLHVVAARPGYEYNYETYAITISSGEKTAAPAVTKYTNGTSYVVTVTSETDGAKFYYTTDGTDPTTSSSEAVNGFAVVPSGVTFKVIAVADGYDVSDVVSVIMSEEETQTCGEVVPEESDIWGGKHLSLGCVTDGATIYYTTNGTDPTTSSLVYDSASGIDILAEGTTEIRAMAAASGYENSEIMTKTITLTKLASPTMKTAQISNGMAIQLTSSEDGVSIYYTTDGTVPNENSTLFSGSYFIIYETSVVSAVAMEKGYVTSSVVSNTIEVESSDNKVATPTAGGISIILGGKKLYLKCETEGASIYYGSSSSSMTNIYTDALVLREEQNEISAYAKKSGMTDSGSVTFKVAIDKAQTPTASIESGSVVEAGTTLELSSTPFEYTSSQGSTTEYECTIFYTTDGTVPTLDSQVYTGAITIDGETRIRAVAAAMGSCVSDILELYYTVEGGVQEGISVDTSGLGRESGVGSATVITGSVEVIMNDVDPDSKRIIAAIYSGDEMLQAISVNSSSGDETVTISGFDVDVDNSGSVVVKVFVFEDDNITPVCKNSVRIY